MPVSAAEEGMFHFPVACTLEKDCWIVNYVDVDSGPGAREYTCGPRTYDGSSGTDIAVRDYRTMQEGVFVFAAADGKVLRVRDGEPDTIRAREDIESLDEKECGNGILIEHDNGVQALYCHLKKGSITVRPGDKVIALQPIAQIGHSGKTEFPHLHFEVIRDGATLDPFTSLALSESCHTPPVGALWKKEIPYAPMALYVSGFTDAPPDFGQIEKNAASPETLPQDSPALVFWAGYFGARQGDRIRLEIIAPDGEVFVELDTTQPKTRARQFYFAGKRNKGLLSGGVYTGRMTVSREDENGMLNRQIIESAVEIKR